MPEPRFSNEGRWVLRVFMNGVHKNFSSHVPGEKGKQIVLAKYRFALTQRDASPDMTVDMAFNLFIADLAVQYGKRTSTYINYERAGRLYILPIIGSKKLADIRRRDWQGLILTAVPVKTDRLSKKSLMDLRGTITRFWRYCMRNDLCQGYILDLYVPSSAPVRGTEILQPEDIFRFVQPSDLWYHNALMFLLYTGIRPGECLGLQRGDIGDNCIYIRRAVNSLGVETPGKTKNAQRVVPLSTQAQKILRETLERSDSEWVFCSPHGKRGSQDGMREHWYKLKEERHLPGCMYSLRHTFVSIMATSGLSEGSMRNLLGHSKSMDSLGVYGHRVNGETARTAEVLSQTFAELSSDSTSSTSA